MSFTVSVESVSCQLCHRCKMCSQSTKRHEALELVKLIFRGGLEWCIVEIFIKNYKTTAKCLPFLVIINCASVKATGTQYVPFNGGLTGDAFISQ